MRQQRRRSLNRQRQAGKPKAASLHALPGQQPFELVMRSLMKRQHKAQRPIRRRGPPLKRQRRLTS